MDQSYLTALAHEFRAGEGSFLLQLRIDLYWDKAAFQRLTEAMRLCCRHYQSTPRQSEHELRMQNQLADKQLADEQFADEYFLQQEDMMLPRWLASGFWYLSIFVRSHTNHPFWKPIIAREPKYYDHAYERLDALASWFFDGNLPWIDEEKGWNSPGM